MAEYTMPKMGADMKDAILTAWKVKEGDQVTKGDIIAEIETEKGDIDVEVFESGIVQEIIAKPGERLPVGAVLAIIQSGDAPTPQTSAIHKDKLAPTKAKGRRMKVSPLARRMAQELGVDLADIPIENEKTPIQKADVEKFFEAQKAKLTPKKIDKADVAADKKEKMRYAIAAAMSKSNREIPHYYLETDIDMSSALAWLQNENQNRSVLNRLLLPALLLKATAKALNDVPPLNAYWENGTVVRQASKNIGLAISLRQGGVVIPAIQAVDQKSIDDVMKELVSITQQARSGRLKSSALTNGTITITYLGDRAVEKVFGVIYPPQVALVGFGGIIEKPWASQGMLGVKPVLTVTLAADHRATDGKTGALFLKALRKYLTEPSEL